MKKTSPFRTGTGSNTPETRQTSARRHARSVSKLVEGQLEHVDFDRVGRKASKGNLSEDQVSVTFLREDFDTFVPHDLGYTAENWSVVRRDRAGDVYHGARRPTKFGLWLRSSVAGLKAVIRVDGQKK